NHFRTLGWLVWRIDPGKVLDRPRPRLGIEPFRVARLAGFQTSLDVNLDKLARLHQFTHHIAIRATWRDKSSQHDQAGISHQARDLANATNVLLPILVGEAQIAVEAMADVVAVEQVTVVPEPEQRL